MVKNVTMPMVTIRYLMADGFCFSFVPDKLRFSLCKSSFSRRTCLPFSSAQERKNIFYIGLWNLYYTGIMPEKKRGF